VKANFPSYPYRELLLISFIDRGRVSMVKISPSYECLLYFLFKKKDHLACPPFPTHLQAITQRIRLRSLQTHKQRTHHTPRHKSHPRAPIHTLSNRNSSPPPPTPLPIDTCQPLLTPSPSYNNTRSNIPSRQMNQRGQWHHCEDPEEKESVAQNGAYAEYVCEFGEDEKGEAGELEGLAEEEDDVVIVPGVLGEVEGGGEVVSLCARATCGYGWWLQRVMLHDVEVLGPGSSFLACCPEESVANSESCFSLDTLSRRLWACSSASWAFASLSRYACAIDSSGRSIRTSGSVCPKDHEFSSNTSWLSVNFFPSKL
jgi:hypothetical protein